MRWNLSRDRSTSPPESDSPLSHPVSDPQQSSFAESHDIEAAGSTVETKWVICDDIALVHVQIERDPFTRL